MPFTSRNLSPMIAMTLSSERSPDEEAQCTEISCAQSLIGSLTCVTLSRQLCSVFVWSRDSWWVSLLSQSITWADLTSAGQRDSRKDQHTVQSAKVLLMWVCSPTGCCDIIVRSKRPNSKQRLDRRCWQYIRVPSKTWNASRSRDMRRFRAIHKLVNATQIWWSWEGRVLCHPNRLQLSLISHHVRGYKMRPLINPCGNCWWFLNIINERNTCWSVYNVQCWCHFECLSWSDGTITDSERRSFSLYVTYHPRIDQG
jgi:hypothetical protein